MSEKKHKCDKNIYGDAPWHPKRCNRPTNLIEDGHPRCSIHCNAAQQKRLDREKLLDGYASMVEQAIQDRAVIDCTSGTPIISNPKGDGVG